MSIALAIALGVAYALRNKLVAPLLIAWLDARLESQSGVVLTVDRVQGDWIDDIELTGVQLVALDERAELRRLTVANVALDISIGKLLRGDFDGIERADVHGVAVQLDLSRTGMARKPPPVPFQLPLMWPACSVDDLDFELRLGPHRVMQFNRAVVEIERGEDSNHTALDVGTAVLDLWPGAPALIERIHGDIAYRGGVMRVDELALTGDVELRAAQSQLDLSALSRGGFGWHADIDAFEGTVRGDGWTGGGALALSLDIDDLAVEELWRVIDPLADSVPHARVDLRTDIGESHGAWSGSGTAAARAICIEDREIDALTADLALRPEALDLERIDVHQGANEAWGEALSIPLRAGSWLDTLRAGRGRIAVDVYDLTALTAVPAADVPPHHLQLAGALGEQGLELTSGKFSTQSGQLIVRRGRMQWGPSADTLLRDAQFDVELDTDFTNLADLGPIFSTREWSGSVRGRAHLTGSIREPAGDVDLVAHGLTAAGFALGDVTALARVEPRRAHVQSLTADGPYGRVEVSGDYDLKNESFEGSHWKASSERLSALLPEIFKSGSADVVADLDGPWRQPTGTFSVRAREFAVASGPTLTKVELSGALGGDLVRVNSFEAQLEEVVMRARGAVRHDQWKMPLSVLVESLEVERQGLGIALDGPTEFRLDNNGFAVHGVRMSGSAGRLHGDLVLAGGDLDVRVSCEDLEPMPLLAPFVNEGFALGHARGEFGLQRTSSSLVFDADFAVDGLRFAAQAPELVLECRGRYDGARATFERAELHASDGGVATLKGDVPFDLRSRQPLSDGDIELDVGLSMPSVETLPWAMLGLPRGYRGAVTGDLQLRGAWRALHGSLNFSAQQLRTLAEPESTAAVEYLLGPTDIDARAVLDDGLTLEHCTLGAPGQIQCDIVGRAELGNDVVELVERGVRGLRETPLELHASMHADDLAFLAPLFNERLRGGAQVQAALRRSGGSITGDFDLNGSLDQPDLRGELHLENGELRLESSLPAFERVSGDVHLEGSRAVLERLKGDFGAGAFEVSGDISFGGDEPLLDLALKGKDIALLQLRGLRLRTKASVTIVGPWSELRTTGLLTLTDGRWTERYDYLSVLNKRAPTMPSQGPWFSLTSKPFANMQFDIDIGAERAFRVDNNLARAALQPSLHLGGTGAEPQLSGDILIEPSRIALPSGYLELLAGTITLDVAEPRRPTVHMTLTTRLRGYDLSVDVSGRFDDPAIVVTSNPPLTSAEAWQLLLTGQLPEGGTIAGNADAAQAVVVFLGQDLLAGMFGNADDGAESLMSRIEWQTGTNVTTTGGSTVEVKLRLSGPSQGPGRALYMRGERDIYDRMNFGMRLVWRFR